MTQGLDRARPKHYVEQLMRRVLDDVSWQEEVEDKQLLLNESWRHYCDRAPGCREAQRNQFRQKWVTETWEEYEARIAKREANITQFFEQAALKEQAAAQKAEEKDKATDAMLELIKQRERRRKARLLPTLHTLLYDPAKEEELKRQAEQEELVKKEHNHRRMLEEDQQRAWAENVQAEADRRRRVEEDARQREEAEAENAEKRRAEELEMQRLAEEEARQAAERDRLLKEQQEEEERRRRAEEEARRKAEEEAREQLRRKAEEEAEDERRRRQLREQAEEELKAREEEERQRQLADEANRRAKNEEMQEKWNTLKAAQGDKMQEFLMWLGEKVSTITEPSALSELLGEVTTRIDFLSTFAVYIGTVSEGGDSLEYQYASPPCSEALRSGVIVLPLEQECPTTTQSIYGGHTVYVRDVPADHSVVWLAGDTADPLLTNPPDDEDGDFMAAPITSGEQVVGVLAADTLTSNPNRADWESCHDPTNLPRHMDRDERDFLSEVARLLGTAFEQLGTDQGDQGQRDKTPSPVTEEALSALDATPRGKTPGILGVYETGVEAIGKHLNRDDVNVYISVPDHQKDLLTVVCQYTAGQLWQRGGTVPPEGTLGRHRHMINKQLASVNKPMSFQLFGPELADTAYLSVPDVTKEDATELYGGDGAKQSDSLLLIPIMNGAVCTAVLGVECESGRPLTDTNLEVILAAAAKMGDRTKPIRQNQQTKQVVKQALQWMEATTSLKHGYYSTVQPDGSMLYVAASPDQEFVIGNVLKPGEGITRTAFDQEDGVVHVDDLADTKGIVYWDPKKLGEEGELVLVAVKRADGTPVGVLGFDTLGADKKKRAIKKEDIDVIRNSADILSEIMTEIEEGTVDSGLGDDRVLSIEKVVGSAGIRFFKKVLMRVLVQLKGLTKDSILEMARYKAPPETIPPVVSATLIVLHHKPKSVSGWDNCRPHIKQELLDKMHDFDATKGGKKSKNFFRRAKGMLRGLNMETVFTKGSLPASLMFQWSYVSIQLRYASDYLRKQAEKGLLGLEEENAPQDHPDEDESEHGGDADDDDDEEEEEE